jgi:hypothetical protein
MSNRNISTTLSWRLCIGLGLFVAGLAGCSSDDGGPPPSGTGIQISIAPDATAPPDSSIPDSSRDGFLSTTDASDASDASDAFAAPPGDAGAPEASSAQSNILIADQFNNRVIEIDSNGNVVWQFGNGQAVAGPTSVVAPNDAERLRNGQTLISGTGDPTAKGPACAALGTGPCPDNRVLLVNQDGGIAWTYTDLNLPACGRVLANGDVLIADQGNNRVIEVPSDAGPTAGPILTLGPAIDGAGTLAGPSCAERTTSGTTLIADKGNGRAVELASDGGLVWQFVLPLTNGAPPQVAYASRLPNGNTLITDTTDALIVEVAADGGVVWTYRDVDDGGPTGPTRAVRLANGHTLISDETDSRVFEIDNGNPPAIVASFHRLAGIGGTLNGPHDAKRVNDYTGISAPPQ